MASHNRRVRTSGASFDDIRTMIRSKPGEVAEELAEEIRVLNVEAIRIMREIIERSSTKTGLALGRQGRIRSLGEASLQSRPRVAGKSMRDHVTQVIRRNSNNISSSFGWVHGYPGYAQFQELGTSNGVPAMNALTEAALWYQQNMQRILIRLR